MQHVFYVFTTHNPQPVNRITRQLASRQFDPYRNHKGMLLFWVHSIYNKATSSVRIVINTSSVQHVIDNDYHCNRTSHLLYNKIGYQQIENSIKWKSSHELPSFSLLY